VRGDCIPIIPKPAKVAVMVAALRILKKSFGYRSYFNDAHALGHRF
jgi:hypothetical protein